MAFGQKKQRSTKSWGVAPGYGDERPSAKALWFANFSGEIAQRTTTLVTNLLRSDTPRMHRPM